MNALSITTSFAADTTLDWFSSWLGSWMEYYLGEICGGGDRGVTGITVGIFFFRSFVSFLFC